MKNVIYLTLIIGLIPGLLFGTLLGYSAALQDIKNDAEQITTVTLTSTTATVTTKTNTLILNNTIIERVQTTDKALSNRLLTLYKVNSIDQSVCQGLGTVDLWNCNASVWNRIYNITNNRDAKNVAQALTFLKDQSILQEQNKTLDSNGIMNNLTKLNQGTIGFNQWYATELNQALLEASVKLAG